MGLESTVTQIQVLVNLRGDVSLSKEDEAISRVFFAQRHIAKEVNILRLRRKQFMKELKTCCMNEKAVFHFEKHKILRISDYYCFNSIALTCVTR